MDEQFVSIGKAAKMIGMSIEGLRHWESAGVLVPMPNQRRYRVADLRALLSEIPEVDHQASRCILYARVSGVSRILCKQFFKTPDFVRAGALGLRNKFRAVWVSCTSCRACCLNSGEYVGRLMTPPWI